MTTCNTVPTQAVEPVLTQLVYYRHLLCFTGIYLTHSPLEARPTVVPGSMASVGHVSALFVADDAKGRQGWRRTPAATQSSQAPLSTMSWRLVRPSLRRSSMVTWSSTCMGCLKVLACWTAALHCSSHRRSAQRPVSGNIRHIIPDQVEDSMVTRSCMNTVALTMPNCGAAAHTPPT